MTTGRIPVTLDVVSRVEEYVRHELSDAAKFDNRAPLDESGIWSLHRLAAEVFGLGFEAGEAAADYRANEVRQRARTAEGTP